MGEVFGDIRKQAVPLATVAAILVVLIAGSWKVLACIHEFEKNVGQHIEARAIATETRVMARTRNGEARIEKEMGALSDAMKTFQADLKVTRELLIRLNTRIEMMGP